MSTQTPYPNIDWTSVVRELSAEMDRLVVAEYEVEEFCFSSHLSWAKSLAPNLIDLISCLLTSRRGSEADDIQNEKATAIVFGVMMRQRSRSKASMVIPMLVSALLLGHATSKQVCFKIV